MSNTNREQQKLLNEIIEKAFEKKKNDNVIDENTLNATLESICEMTGMSRDEAEEIAKEVIEEHKNSTEPTKASEPLESPKPSKSSKSSKPSNFLLPRLVFSWFFGCFFLLLSILAFSKTLLGALCFFVIACLLLPPVRQFAYIKTGNKISFTARVFIIFLFMTFGVLTGERKDKEAQDIEKAKEHAEVVELIQYRKQ
ncbi:type IV secretion system protein [Vibrio sp. Of7-15]|uniref:type IV secretion system protein n=1 Tax=Vibrio sp. Of7-15 TaxID=2724879 RepID=UPI001EF291B2|nr:type IV secretion system protein [Vibrio sp. Of7-15]MCG7497779.1 type IV secretion system protein [Vibrio sp. Of7-15]